MVVGDDVLDAVKTALPECQEEVLPARLALTVGEVDAEHVAAALEVDADRHEYRLAGDHAGLPDLLVARVEDQVGEGLLQPPTGEGGKLGVEALVDPADRRGRSCDRTAPP